MVRPMRKTRAPTQSQRAIGHIAALQSIATMFVMHAMVGRSTLQFKMPRLDAYASVNRPGAVQIRIMSIWAGACASTTARTSGACQRAACTYLMRTGTWRRKAFRTGMMLASSVCARRTHLAHDRC